MAKHSVRLTLVSASPRRRELLSKLGQPYDVLPSHAAERWLAVNPSELAVSNARRKVERSETFGDMNRVLLGADTIIAFDGRIFGKPAGLESARRMLQDLSGRWHDVITGVFICGPSTGKKELYVDSAAVTHVRFHHLSADDVEGYLRSDEWRGKAGAYAIQGIAGSFAARLDGDFENVVGLPTGLIYDLLNQRFGHCRFL